MNRGGTAQLPTESAVDEEWFAPSQTLITSRQSVSPRWLAAPGPSPAQVEALLSLAAAAPDHGRIVPWRFIIVPPHLRHRLGEAFAQALIDRDPDCTPQQIEDARAKAARAPFLMIAIACLGPKERDIPTLERMISLGAAVQNVLLGAHAMGFAAALTSGRAMSSPRMKPLCNLAEGEVPVCCVNIGTATRNGPSRARPATDRFTTTLA